MTFRSNELDTDDTLHEMDELFTVLASRNADWMDLHNFFAAQTAKLETTGRTNCMGLTQNTKIINHMKKAGSITMREALVEYSIQSLTKRINELRNSGHNIESVQKRHPITKQRYVRYYLKVAA